MFICGICGKPSKPNERCTIIQVETKEALHPFRSAANYVKREDGKREWTPDQGGRGVQIVKEIKACSDCASARQHK